MAAFDAVVLAGGAGRRLGGVDKAMLIVDGRPLLTHVLDALVGAERVVVVGPARPIDGAVTWVREEPAGGGPVSGLAAGLAVCTAPLVFVAACDQPRLSVSVVQALLDAVADDGCVLVRMGRDQPLCAAYRRAALMSAVDRLPQVSGASVRQLVTDLVVARLDDDWGASADVDTPRDLAAARGRART